MKTALFCSPDGSELRVPLTGSPLILGRPGIEADVVLDGDRAVSRRHGRIWWEDDRTWYEDLGSSNGSWLENQRLGEPVELTTGLKLRLGNTVLTVEAEANTGLTARPQDEPRPCGAEANTGLTARLQDEPPATVRMAVPATGRLEKEAMGGRYLRALFDVTQGLLRSSSQQLVSSTITRLTALIPGVQQIVLVNWPPSQETELDLQLATYAVNHDQALLALGSIYVPLFGARRETLGVLWVDAPNISFNDAEFQLFRAAGELLASALSAEQLREDARTRELEAREQRARKIAMGNFLKIASHDLKNPLAVVQVCAQLLDCYNHDPERVAAMAGDLMDAARRALSLIESYMQVAEVESGRELHIDWHPIDVEPLILGEIAFLQRALGTEQFSFSVEVDVDEVWADPVRLQQILSNLISNAVKYSPNGGEIRITVVGPSAGGKEEVTFRIRDQGVGIALEDQSRLFRQFERLGNPGLVPGQGLGLWLTQSLVEAHGGRLSVESASGLGSTFVFTIPL